jgi:hypothetical protein
MTIAEHYVALIREALATPGGHLSIGGGGFTLHVAWGRTLTGDLAEPIKRLAIEAGLPVIDDRSLDFDTRWELGVRGPMVAVGHDPSPQPWGSFSHAPLAVIAGAYRAAGAEIHNLPPDIATSSQEGALP